MTIVSIIDESEPLYGVRIGDHINTWVSQSTKNFMENYEPDLDEPDWDEPDYEGTPDHVDVTDPREQDWDEVR